MYRKGYFSIYIFKGKGAERRGWNNDKDESLRYSRAFHILFGMLVVNLYFSVAKHTMLTTNAASIPNNTIRCSIGNIFIRLKDQFHKDSPNFSTYSPKIRLHKNSKHMNYLPFVLQFRDKRAIGACAMILCWSSWECRRCYPKHYNWNFEIKLPCETNHGCTSIQWSAVK